MADISFSINLNNLGFTVNLLIDQLGAILFMMMVYVIVKHKKLHDSPCLKLIGIFMFCCLCSKFFIVFPYLIVVLPLRNVPLWLCFATQLVPFSFVNAILPTTVAMGFDRVLSMFFPLWHCLKRKTLYFFVVCVALALNPLYLSGFLIANVIENGANQTNCTSQQLFGKTLSPLNLEWNLNYLTIVFYAIMVLKLLWDGREGRQTYFNRQPLFKSFAIIIAIQVLGQWAIYCAYRYVPSLFVAAVRLTEIQIPLVYYGINCFSSLVTTAQFWSIYFTSVEHRSVLVKKFPRFFFVTFRRQISPIVHIMNNNIMNHPVAVNNNNNPAMMSNIFVRSVHHTN